MADVRSTAAYQAFRTAIRSVHLADDDPCHLCGAPIDYTLPHGHRHAYQLDHLHKVDTHPHLALDPTNAAASHATCNAADGARHAHGKRRLGPTTEGR